MPEYVVDLCYSCYATVEVEAKDEDEALEKARGCDRDPAGYYRPIEIDHSSLARWLDADMVHES